MRAPAPPLPVIPEGLHWRPVHDLTHPLDGSDEVFLVQALSGGELGPIYSRP